MAQERGRKTIAVVASCCTTSTGSFDPLPELADFCDEHDLWLHVDGAHGASLLMSDRYRSRLAGIDRADSVVWDLHKMMALPALNTAVLFAERRRSYEALAQEASYLFGDTDPEAEWFNVGRRTLECTKRGMAVTAYSALQHHGTEVFAEHVDMLMARTEELAALLAASDDFELGHEPDANILCFRHLPEGMSPGAGSDDLDQHQARIRRRMLQDGSFYIVQTKLRGSLWLRVTVMNPFTDGQHLRGMIAKIRQLAKA